MFCDDQQEILDECLSLQSGRARGNRVKRIKARFGAQQSLDPLVRFLAEREVGDFSTSIDIEEFAIVLQRGPYRYCSNSHHKVRFIQV